jgi:hypothetical protein
MGLFAVDARQKRLFVYMVVGFVPLVIVYVGLLFGLGSLLSFVAGGVVALIALMAVHNVTMNTLSRFELDGAPVLQTADSLGVLNFYQLSVAPKDRIASAKVDAKNVQTSYSVSNVFYSYFNKEKIPAWSDETHFHVLIPKGEKDATTFKSQAVPTFLFNRRLNSFWTKSSFAQVEDGMTLENNVSYLAYSTRNFEESTRNYARSAIDKLWEKFIGGNLWIIIAVLVIILLLFIFGGDIVNFANGLINGGTDAIAKTSGALTVPTEATQPLR